MIVDLPLLSGSVGVASIVVIDPALSVPSMLAFSVALAVALPFSMITTYKKITFLIGLTFNQH